MVLQVLQQTVYLVDDDPAMCRSFRSLMESVPLAHRVFETASEFLDACDVSWQGCVVLDSSMPCMSGLEMLEHLPAPGIHLPIIIVAGHADVPMAVRAMKAGVVDFLEKPCEPQVLLECINRAFALDMQWRKQGEQRAEVRARLVLLTPREREVLDLIVKGKEHKEIAAQLGISRKTLDAHRARVMQKMHAVNLVDLVRQFMVIVESVPQNCHAAQNVTSETPIAARQFTTTPG